MAVLMVVPKHERLVRERKGESMCRDLVVQNGYFLTRTDVSLSPVALVRKCTESNDSKECTNVFASRQPYLLEDSEFCT